MIVESPSSPRGISSQITATLEEDVWISSQRTLSGFKGKVLTFKRPSLWSEGSLEPRLLLATTHAIIESPRTKLNGEDERSSIAIVHELEVVVHVETSKKLAGDLAQIWTVYACKAIPVPPVEVGLVHWISTFIPDSVTVTPDGTEGFPYITIPVAIGDQSPHPKIFSALYLALYPIPLESPDEMINEVWVYG